MNKIDNKPPKGTSDWFPEEYRVRKYIFDTWRRVCTSFGFEEYLTPMVESANVYRAKSGEDIGGKELITFEDQAGRELAIKPEMTPSVTRMVSRVYQQTPKPIKYFSITNFMRNEKPQRGRNREFWQLNADIFGSDSLQADIELLQLALEIMLAFNPPAGSFTLFINNRKLIDALFAPMLKTPEANQEIFRILDKFSKLSTEEFTSRLTNLGLLEADIMQIRNILTSKSADELVANIPQISQNEGLLEILEIMKALTELGYGDWIKFDPSVIRGFDYYDGIVFEVFDNNPENNRAMFGGGRYNGLANIFISENIPASGFAPGDETTKLFLESWGLLDKVLQDIKAEIIYIPLLDASLMGDIRKFAKAIRSQGKNVSISFDVHKIGKALEYADKQGFDYVLIFDTAEKEKGIVGLKNMRTGEQKEVSVTKFADSFLVTEALLLIEGQVEVSKIMKN